MGARQLRRGAAPRAAHCRRARWRGSLSCERPIAILSGNSIEHLLLAFGAIWAGIPYCPVSPAYSQGTSDLQKLRQVFDLLTPGLVAAFDTPRFERALAAVVPADVEIIGDVSLIDSRVLTQLADLEADPAEAEGAAHAATGPDSIVKFLLTSGSTGTPKAVITTERMLCSNAIMTREAMPFVVDEPPVIVDWLPWNHTFGGSHNVGLVLFNGGSLYIDDGKPTPAAFADTLRNLRDVSPTRLFQRAQGLRHAGAAAGAGRDAAPQLLPATALHVLRRRGPRGSTPGMSWMRRRWPSAAPGCR